jgi:hypothetical protein
VEEGEQVRCRREIGGVCHERSLGKYLEAQDLQGKARSGATNQLESDKESPQYKQTTPSHTDFGDSKLSPSRTTQRRNLRVM